MPHSVEGCSTSSDWDTEGIGRILRSIPEQYPATEKQDLECKAKVHSSDPKRPVRPAGTFETPVPGVPGRCFGLQGKGVRPLEKTAV
ncbi:hypothetical protein HOY80DRAFT_1045877 [Tuber brumale]|nr:hypothetical protein HOY80DRAFT_1045877 [Tuber brumale]